MYWLLLVPLLLKIVHFISTLMYNGAQLTSLGGYLVEGHTWQRAAETDNITSTPTPRIKIFQTRHALALQRTRRHL